jgi:uncharacterized protein with von Willebrand factor type A (vWA) domain
LRGGEKKRKKKRERKRERERERERERKEEKTYRKVDRERHSRLWKKSSGGGPAAESRNNTMNGFPITVTLHEAAIP